MLIGPVTAIEEKKSNQMCHSIIRDAQKAAARQCEFRRVPMTTKKSIKIRGVEWVHGLFLFPLILGKM